MVNKPPAVDDNLLNKKKYINYYALIEKYWLE